MFDDAMIISISNRKESESVAMKRTCSNGSIRSRHTRTNCLPRGCIISQSSYHHRRNVGSCSPTGGGGGRRFKSENPFPQPMADLLVMLFCLLSAREIMAFSNSFHGMPTGGRLHIIISPMPPLQKKTTSSIFYRINQDDDSNNIIAHQSKRSKLTKLKPSSTIKKNKLHKQKLQSYKNAFPTSEQELAHHVQSYFSDNFNEEERDDDECTILSEEEDASSRLEYCKKLAAHPALVLNADYRPLRMLPLSTWSWQDSIKSVLSGKAVVVDIYPNIFVRAVSLDMPVPSVIALREYAPAGKAKPAFTRRNVFLRDGYRCQYCSKLFRTSDLSLDHVEPRCMGGQLTWENTVTSCRKCNGRKGCIRPSELHVVGMSLKSKPRCPSIYELSTEANKFVPRRVHTTWAPFLGLEVMPAKNQDCVRTRKQTSD